MFTYHRLRTGSGKRGGVPAAMAGWCAVTLFLGGCAYTQRTPLAQPTMSDVQLTAMAMDPTRPLDGRLVAARFLDASGRQDLEASLLNDLPQLWGLEWRARLTLLGAIGGPATVDQLGDLRASNQLPELDRVDAAIDTTIQRIQARLEADDAAVPDSRVDS